MYLVYILANCHKLNIILLIVSGDIGNTLSPDLLYRGLVTLLGWSLSRIALNKLITISILF